MTKQLLCEECAKDKQEGFRAIERYPGEYERVQWGKAKQPTREQRVMYINGVPHDLGMDSYTCDLCSRSIKPGDKACAWTLLTDHDVHNSPEYAIMSGGRVVYRQEDPTPDRPDWANAFLDLS